MTTKRIFRILAVLQMCSLVAAQGAATQAVAPQGASQASGAQDSNYVDLASLGSSKLQTAIDNYLRECGLRIGENPNGLWVQTGVSDIKGVAGSRGWGEARKVAFIQASLNAQVELARSLAMQNMVITINSVSGDSSINPQEQMKSEDFNKRVQGKLEALTEATLDNALKDAGVDVPPSEQVESKRTLYLDSLTRKSMAKAIADVSGFYALQTFEAVDESNSGKVSIGVVIGRRPNSMGWISLVAKGGGAQGVPREKPGKSLNERIPNDPKILFERFGTRVVADEGGQLCIIAYGQSSPEITKGMSPQRVAQMLDIARRDARDNADQALTDFLKSNLMWQGKNNLQQVEKTLAVQGALDGVSIEREETTLNLMKQLDQESKTISTAFVKGATKFLEWQGNHPEFGNPIVGYVSVWTPAAAAASDRYSAPGNPASGQPGFVPKGATPGVRASSGEDKPNGKGDLKEEPQPVSVGAGSSCDGTEAVGEGLDNQSAILDALENAVRQACGVAIASTTESKKRSESSIVDIRVNEVCAEMRETLSASSLLSQDISVRSKGFVKEYRILSEEQVASNRIRIRICAQVPQFDPRNPRPGAKPTLIVLPPTSRQSAFAVMGNRVTSDEVSRSLETEMARELFRMKVFTLLERERLSAVLGEQQFIASGLADLKEQVKLGKLSAADSVLISEVEDVVATQEEKVIKLTGNRVVKRYAGAKINWRIVSVGTGEVLDQDSVSISLDEDGFRQMSSLHPGTPIPTALMAMAVAKLAPEVASRAAPLRVAAVVGDKIFLNRGKETLSAGQQFSVYRQGGELKDPTTGASLGRSESKVGAIKVERAEADFSIAVVVAGQLGSEDAGSVCRKG